MSKKRRVYIIRKTPEPVDQDILSNLSKVMDNLDIDLTQKTISMRLYRAKQLTGHARIRLKDNNGEYVTIEIRDVD